MNLHDGGINHGVSHVRFLRQGIKNPLENIGFAPIAKPPECGAPVAEHGWQIAPRTARPNTPKNRLNKQPIGPAAASGAFDLPRQCGSIFAHQASVNTTRSSQSVDHIFAKMKILNPHNT
jgi:hypothetical protein